MPTHVPTFNGKYHRALDSHGVPRTSEHGARLTFEQRLTWLASHRITIAITIKP